MISIVVISRVGCLGVFGVRVRTYDFGTLTATIMKTAVGDTMSSLYSLTPSGTAEPVQAGGLTMINVLTELGNRNC